MRIQEEQERRGREAQILARLPRALEEAHHHLASLRIERGGEPLIEVGLPPGK